MVRNELRDEIKKSGDEIRLEFISANNILKRELGQVKEKAGEIKARLNQMEGRRHNGLRRLLYYDIASIGAYRPNIGFQTPKYFPKSVQESWNLQFPRNGT
jgi:hypothetical protein